MSITQYQAAILAFLYEKLQLTDPVSTLDGPLSGSFAGSFYAAHGEVDYRDDGTQIVFTLPTYTNSVFLGLTQSRPVETALLLTNIEDYERETSVSVKPGETIRFPEDTTQVPNLPFGVVIVPIGTSLDTDELPDCHEIDGKHTTFALAVPITRAEYDIKKQRGYDALIDHWEQTDKSLYF